MCHLKSWIFEGRNKTSKKFALLDSQTNNSDLNGYLFEHKFFSNEGIFKQLRLTIKGPSWADSKIMIIDEFGFIGEIAAFRKTEICRCPNKCISALDTTFLISLTTLFQTINKN